MAETIRQHHRRVLLRRQWSSVQPARSGVEWLSPIVRRTTTKVSSCVLVAVVRRVVLLILFEAGSSHQQEEPAAITVLARPLLLGY
jgi:hypothetical protein